MIVMKSRRTFIFTILAVVIILLSGYVYRQIEPSSAQNKASREETRVRLPLKKANSVMVIAHPNPAKRNA